MVKGMLTQDRGPAGMLRKMAGRQSPRSQGDLRGAQAQGRCQQKGREVGRQQAAGGAGPARAGGGSRACGPEERAFLSESEQAGRGKKGLLSRPDRLSLTTPAAAR